MKSSLSKLYMAAGLLMFYIVFQPSSVFAAELKVISIKQGDIINELVITENTVINAEDGFVVPKLIIANGVEIVEINAEVQILEVVAQNKVELNGKGNISDILISTDKEVSINTIGNIQKIEVTNKDAKLVVKEGTKITELIIPEGSKATDIISNYEQAKDRFENVSSGTPKEPPVVEVSEPRTRPEPLPTPEQTPEPTIPPSEDPSCEYAIVDCSNEGNPTDDDTTTPPSGDNNPTSPVDVVDVFKGYNGLVDNGTLVLGIQITKSDFFGQSFEFDINKLAYSDGSNDYTLQGAYSNAATPENISRGTYYYTSDQYWVRLQVYLTNGDENSIKNLNNFDTSVGPVMPGQGGDDSIKAETGWVTNSSNTSTEGFEKPFDYMGP